MASTPRIATWVAWYLDQAQKDGPLGDLDSKPLSYFDSVPTAYLSQPIRFVAEVATHEGRNFLSSYQAVGTESDSSTRDSLSPRQSDLTLRSLVSGEPENPPLSRR